MPRRAGTLLLALGLLLGARAPAGAQAKPSATGAIGESVTILFPPLTAAGVRPLTFGVILPGTTRATVLPATPQGGEWRITGMAHRKSIQISFTLPAVLRNASGTPLPLSFDGNYAAACEVDDATGACDPVTYQTWNPVATPSLTDLPERAKPGRPKFTNADYTVYLGGEALPSPGQQGGRYTGTITVNVIAN